MISPVSPLVGDLQAHGIGGQQDLPISLGLAVSGAVAALVVSFTVLAAAWRKPRYAAAGDEAPGRPAPAWVQSLVDRGVLLVVGRVFGMVLFLFTVVVSVAGEDTVINPFFGIVYVWLWVGIVPMSLLLGPFWRTISPVRTINALFARLSGSDPREGLYRYPARLGYWPAAFGLLAFVWLELVFPSSTELSPVRLWFAVYVAVMLVGGALFGHAFFEHADPFEVYSTLVGKLSVWGRHEDRVVVLSPLANLATTRVAPGLVGVVGVLFGSTGFDSFGESPTWVKFLQGTEVSGYLLTNLALLAFCAGATAIFALGCVLTGVGPDTPRRALPDLLAHSIVPIIVGYVVAHYLSYFLEVGSRTLAYASDPFSTGANYFGTADLPDLVWLSYHPTLLATIKVGAVVAGHVVAATAAHDRALQLLPRRHQLTGQIPLLIAMVGFTSGGLLLLFSS
ncbi:hypothetical protein [Nocardioides litoris]|uniref:hypothetical protein n=1 Tax=Nocardioides litoris TaxID=1926648 RepID=UPI0011203F7C|nr:hypothetical protein [Nocardioides litoris]